MAFLTLSLLYFPLLHFLSVLFTPAFSMRAILPVVHFPLPHFQSPHWDMLGGEPNLQMHVKILEPLPFILHSVSLSPSHTEVIEHKSTKLYKMS